MWKNLMRGVVGGLAGAAAHTTVMLVARSTGLGGTLPPRAITDRMLHHLGIHPKHETRTALAAANHVGYGMATGALFGVAMPRMSRPRSMLAGAAYGLALWFTSYEGWVPAIGALPPARRDRPDRQAMLIAAHVAFGTVLGAIAAKPRPPEPENLRADPTLAPSRDVAAASAITDA
jgi:hypothetical protein